MKSSTKDQAKGKFHNIIGTIKEAAGVLSKNHKLEVKGKREKNTGKAQEKVGQIKKVMGK